LTRHFKFNFAARRFSAVLKRLRSVITDSYRRSYLKSPKNRVK